MESPSGSLSPYAVVVLCSHLLLARQTNTTSKCCSQGHRLELEAGERRYMVWHANESQSRIRDVEDIPMQVMRLLSSCAKAGLVRICIGHAVSVILTHEWERYVVAGTYDHMMDVAEYFSRYEAYCPWHAAVICQIHRRRLIESFDAANPCAIVRQKVGRKVVRATSGRLIYCSCHVTKVSCNIHGRYAGPDKQNVLVFEGFRRAIELGVLHRLRIPSLPVSKSRNVRHVACMVMSRGYNNGIELLVSISG